MLRGNPTPPPTSIFFYFPSLFKKKSENFGGLNPPPLKYALNAIDQGNIAITCLLDLKSNDTVNHSILISRLYKYMALEVPLLSGLSYLTNRQQFFNFIKLNLIPNSLHAAYPKAVFLDPYSSLYI